MTENKLKVINKSAPSSEVSTNQQQNSRQTIILDELKGQK
jgi:hypothetical protein